MPSPTDALTAGLVRETVTFDRLPWIRPLVPAVASGFDRVASLFVGDPSRPEAWQAVIDRLRDQTHERDAIATILQAQLTRRGAPTAAIGAAADLSRPDAVAVVTGQQAGLFGGPFYTLLKAVTTIQLARRTQERHGVPAVPIFWVDGDDHDWDEIRAAHVLDRDGAPVSVTAGDLPGAGRLPVSALTFDAGIDATIEGLAAALPSTEFTPDLLERLRTRFKAGVSPATAFACWLDDLLGSEGLVVFEPSDPAAKRLAASVFAGELADPCAVARLVRDAGQAMDALGHAPQIVPTDDTVCLFRIDENGRVPLKPRDGQMAVGDRQVALDELRHEAETHPERFSPNVVLRPIVQDSIFPTVCYVAGPAELAYHAQLGPVYERFGVVRPLVVNRASATVLDGAAVRFLERSGLAFESLRGQDDTVLNRLLLDLMPAAVDTTFTDVRTWLDSLGPRLRDAAQQVDPTLAGAADTTVARIAETVKNLHGKILQAAKKKDETLRRQFVRTRALLFPEGHPQERHLNVAFFLNRYGPDLGSRLVDGLPVDTAGHLLLTL